MDIEEWRAIPGFEGSYEVSNMGQIRSLDRVVRRKDGRTCRYPGKILKPHDNPDHSPYLTVNLSKGNKYQRSYIHALVLEAFVGKRPPGMECCHGDGGPHDNRVSNLRWGTPLENNLDILRHGHHENANKTHCIHGHEYTPENTVRVKKYPTRRWCRECMRARSREYMRRKSAAARRKRMEVAA